jgi:hypothetical protein
MCKRAYSLLDKLALSSSINDNLAIILGGTNDLGYGESTSIIGSSLN